MDATTFIQDCLKRRLIFFTGKGGVGKTSLAWATAVACQKAGKKVTVASWAPYGNSLGLIPQQPQIKWVGLDTESAFHEYVLQIMKFEKIYSMVFDNPILKTFINTVPGLSETVIAGKVWDMWDRSQQELLIVDLPASGHTLSFFESPLGVSKVFHVGLVSRNTKKICDMFTHPSVRLDIVTLPEELPTTEAGELKDKLSKLHPLNFGYLHVNRWAQDFGITPEETAQTSADIQDIVQRYQQRQSSQQELMPKLSSIGMPILQHPRLGLENQQGTIVELARSLAS